MDVWAYFRIILEDLKWKVLVLNPRSRIMGRLCTAQNDNKSEESSLGGAFVHQAVDNNDCSFQADTSLHFTLYVAASHIQQI